MAELGQVSNASHVINVGMDVQSAFQAIEKLKNAMKSLSGDFNINVGNKGSQNELRNLLNNQLGQQKQLLDIQKRQAEVVKQEAVARREVIRAEEEEIKRKQMLLNLSEKEQQAQLNATKRAEQYRKIRDNQLRDALKGEQLNYKGIVDERKIKFDISAAKQQMEQLYSLAGDEGSKVPNPFERLPVDINEASNAIKKTLIVDIQQATKELMQLDSVKNEVFKEQNYKNLINTRKLDFQIEVAKTKMQDLYKIAGDAGVSIPNPFERLPVDLKDASDVMKTTLLQDIKQATTELKNLDVVKQQLNKPLTFMEDFGVKFAKITKWMSAVWTLQAVRGVASGAVDTIRNMQVAMIDLEKVMDSSTTNFQEMRQAAFDLGEELGRLPEEVAKTMYEFARQGKAQAEVLQLTRTALMASNITDMSADDSIKYLTAATLQLGLEARDTMEILDSWNEVSNKNAVSANQLAEAFSHTASVAKNLGLDINELNAIITIMAANTGKSGDEIGRALKTSLQRVYTPELQSTLSSVLDIGVFKPGTTEMRNLGGVLKEIANSWETLSDAQKNAVASGFGGARYVNDMIILFENLNTMGLKVAEESMNSFGSAARENAKYMESLDRQLESLSTSVGEFFVAIGDTGVLGVVQTGIDLLKLLFNAFNLIPKPLKQAAISFGLVKLGGIALNAVLGDYVPILKNAGKSTMEFVKHLVLTRQATTATTVATVANNTAMGASVGVIGKVSIALKALGSAAWASLGPWGLLAGGILAVSSAYQYFKKRSSDAEYALVDNIKSTNEAIKATQARIASLRDVQSAIQDLESSSLSESEVQSRQLQIYDKFNNIMPGVVRGYDQLKNTIESLIETQTRQLDLSERNSEVLKQMQIGVIDSDLGKIKSERERLQNLYEKASEYLNVGDKASAMMVLDRAGFAGMIDSLKAMVNLPVDEVLVRAFGEFEEKLKDINGQIKELEMQRESLVGGSPSSFAISEADGIERIIQLYGQYAYQLQEISTNASELIENMGLALDADIQAIVEHINNQSESVKDAIELVERYFDGTGRGIEEYAQIVRQVSKDMVLDNGITLWSEETLNLVKIKQAQDLLKTLTEGSDEYYAVLGKVIEAEKYFVDKLKEQEDAIKRAFDFGAIDATTLYAELARIEDVQVFEKQREAIRKMNDELRTGTVSAIEKAFGSMIRGEDNVLEDFQKAINDIQSNTLAKGFAGFVESSDFFRQTMARQQNALATLFGGQDTRVVSIDEKILDVQQEQALYQQATAGNTAALLDAFKSVPFDRLDPASRLAGNVNAGVSYQVPAGANSISAITRAVNEQVVRGLSDAMPEAGKETKIEINYDRLSPVSRIQTNLSSGAGANYPSATATYADVVRSVRTQYEEAAMQALSGQGAFAPPQSDSDFYKLLEKDDSLREIFLTWLRSQGDIADNIANYLNLSFRRQMGAQAWDELVTGSGKNVSAKDVAEFTELLGTFLGEQQNLIQRHFDANRTPDIVTNDKYGTIEISSEDMNLFARLVAAEARGESEDGQLAVIGSVLNRVLEGNYGGDTVGKVILADGQYEPVITGAINDSALDAFVPAMEKLIRETLATGLDYSGGATDFYNPKISSATGGAYHEGNIHVGTRGNHMFSRPAEAADYKAISEWNDQNSMRIVADSNSRLWNWARDYETTVAAIQAANQMGSSTTVKPGVEYIIPRAEKTALNDGIHTVAMSLDILSEDAIIFASSLKSSNEHVVQAGETLSGIAQLYGTTVDAIAKRNNISNIHKINMGQILTIPLDGFSQGGFTGGNQRLKVAGVVHENEWVAPKWMLDKYPEIFSKLEGIRNRGFAGGGYTSNIPDLGLPISQTLSLTTIEEHLANIDTNTSDINKSVDGRSETWKTLGETLPGIAKSVDTVNTEIVKYNSRLDTSIKKLATDEPKESEYWERVVAELDKAWSRRSSEFVKGTVSVIDSLKPFAEVINPLVRSLDSLNLLATDGANLFSGKTTSDKVKSYVSGFMKDLGVPNAMANPLTGFAGDIIGSLFGQSDFLNMILNAVSIFGVIKSAQKELKGFSLTRALGFANGGFTGGNQKLRVAGVVHEGEFVVPKWMVKKYPDIVANLEQVRKRGYANGGYTQSGYPVVGGSSGIPRISASSAASEIKIKLSKNLELDIHQIAVNTKDIKDSYQQTAWKNEVAQLVQSSMGDRTRVGPLADVSAQARLSGLQFDKRSARQAYFGEGDVKGYLDMLQQTVTRGNSEQYFEFYDLINSMPQEELQGLIMMLKEMSYVSPDDLAKLGGVVQELYSGAIDELDEALRFLQEVITLKAEEINAADSRLLEKTSSIFQVDTTVTDWASAFQSPKAWQNAIASATMMAGQTGSSTASMFAMMAGFMKNTSFEISFGEKLAESGLGFMGTPSDILQGFGSIMGGFKQNMEEAGSGVANIVTGLGSLAGGPWAAVATIAGPLIQGFFNRNKEEQQKEAEQIGNVRHFVSSSDGLGASDRFYMSGRHAALMQGEVSSPVFNITTNVDVKASEGMSEQAVAQAVAKELSNPKMMDTYFRSFSREYAKTSRRGV